MTNIQITTRYNIVWTCHTLSWK